MLKIFSQMKQSLMSLKVYSEQLTILLSNSIMSFILFFISVFRVSDLRMSISRAMISSCFVMKMSSRLFPASSSLIDGKFILLKQSNYVIIYMLEQLKIQTDKGSESQVRFQTLSPSHNKLQNYFNNSTFLNKQEEISIFIKNFPQIHLNQIKSPNTLIALLIKQNELLTEKCQQQINMMRESFQKHEELIKNAKQAKSQVQEIKQEKKQLERKILQIEKGNIKNVQAEAQQRKLQSECVKIQIQLKEAKEQNQQALKIIELLTSLNYKKCEEYLKQTNLLLKVDKTSLFSHCHQQKRKNKYYAKVKSCCKEFCARLNKVAEVVSPKVLAEQLEKETSSFLNLIDEMIVFSVKPRRKRTEKSINSEGKLSMSELQNSTYQNENTFFQKMLRKIAQNVESSTQTKEQICVELESVRKALSESKEYYENYVNNLRKTYENDKQQKQNKLNLKEETINFYEEEIHKAKQNMEKAEEQNRELESQLMGCKREVQLLSLELEERVTSFRKKIQEMEEERKATKTQMQKKIKQINDFNELKLSQREEMMKEIEERRKKEQTENEKKISEQKKQIYQLEDTIAQKNSQSRKLVCEIQDLQKRATQIQLNHQAKQKIVKNLEQELNNEKITVEKQSKEINSAKSLVKECEHEKQLQNAYISQLEAKIQTLTSKIKNLDSKHKNDATSKKQIANLRDNLAIEQEKITHFEAYCTQVKEENQRLKIIIKEMKKQLEDVYVKIQELKKIQTQRERLLEEVQESERAKANYSKQFESSRMQTLKVQAENKKLSVELKHYKSIVQRIQVSDYLLD